ncbi:ABC-F family ATP-binding cassette domain-containing protein [Microlunatus parietis]|uniref:ATPase subunit of ABC transporter with duplicated ATPase domains n=1 Tax=Microlunatus parietis TaxID=682979 RepID=A0A7Y9IF80_9ACTN|nr:ATP-binding cassette domain-containing protein [Microlunatus parietis]NYE75109.1 ATPase subunit of ABC transporter with duplicated ATPase domains [Microlunatus parietis]
MPDVLVCHQLSFAWPDGTVVFDRLEVAFPRGRTAVVGRNGAGKSTLIKLLAGDLSPTSGTVTGATRIGYLPQDLVLAADRTVAEVLGVADVLAALAVVDRGEGGEIEFEVIGDRWDVEAEVGAALSRFGFDGIGLDRTIGTLSGGESVLIALAALLLDRPDVLILDEPTNNLDRNARERLYAAVDDWRGAVILVSHDRELLERVDQTAEVRDGEVRIYGGPYSLYMEAVQSEQQAAQRALRNAEADLRRQRRELIETREKLDRRQRYAKGQQDNVPRIVAGNLKRKAQVSAAKLMDTSRGELAEATAAVAAAEERVRDDDLIKVDLGATTVPSRRDVVIAEDLVLRNGLELSLRIRGPERLALVGRNGVGKTTLINTIMGTLPPRQGTIEVKVPASLLPQRLTVLDDDETVLAGVSRLAPTADDNTLRSQLAKFLLGAEVVARRVGDLSGGERFRASLAALLLAEPPPQLLILDEPTNNLDLDSVAQLTSALRQYRGALLVASHDRHFLDDLELTGRLDLDARDTGVVG